jgi:glycine cleavage system H protein
MKIPENLKYTTDHEWAKIEDGIATIGITDFAQDSLGDIVFVELPEEGTELEVGDSFGVVESIKSVSDLYAPLAGKVLEKNSELEDQPGLCNEAPFDSWMIKLKLSSNEDSTELMDAKQYKEYCEGLD